MSPLGFPTLSPLLSPELPPFLAVFLQLLSGFQELLLWIWLLVCPFVPSLGFQVLTCPIKVSTCYPSGTL